MGRARPTGVPRRLWLGWRVTRRCAAWVNKGGVHRGAMRPAEGRGIKAVATGRG
jgi:hypothetical protein